MDNADEAPKYYWECENADQWIAAIQDTEDPPAEIAAEIEQLKEAVKKKWSDEDEYNRRAEPPRAWQLPVFYRHHSCRQHLTGTNVAFVSFIKFNDT